MTLSKAEQTRRLIRTAATFAAEKERFYRLGEGVNAPNPPNWKQIIELVEDEMGWDLSEDEQAVAVEAWREVFPE